MRWCFFFFFSFFSAYIGVGRVFPHWLDAVLEQVVVCVMFHLVGLLDPVEVASKQFDLDGHDPRLV